MGCGGPRVGLNEAVILAELGKLVQGRVGGGQPRTDAASCSPGSLPQCRLRTQKDLPGDPGASTWRPWPQVPSPTSCQPAEPGSNLSTRLRGGWERRCLAREAPGSPGHGSLPSAPGLQGLRARPARLVRPAALLWSPASRPSWLSPCGGGARRPRGATDGEQE